MAKHEKGSALWPYRCECGRHYVVVQAINMEDAIKRGREEMLKEGYSVEFISTMRVSKVD